MSHLSIDVNLVVYIQTVQSSADMLSPLLTQWVPDIYSNELLCCVLLTADAAWEAGSVRDKAGGLYS